MSIFRRHTLIIFFAFSLFLAFDAAGQLYETERYQKVRVYLEDKSLGELGRLGVEIEHGYNRRTNTMTNFYAERDVKAIIASGFKTDILIEDAIAHYLEVSKGVVPNHQQIELRNEGGCGDLHPKYSIPVNFKYGSLGYYYTLDEMMAELDEMYAKFPNLITRRDSLINFKTKRNNYIQYVKISDNPAIDESDSENQILYTALHHAREPMSVMQMIYFMWYVLENYHSDPEIRFLLDRTELFFVPCVNPDGYIFNEINYPTGGGMWRKNRNNTFFSPYGIDLNRNYGQGWGYDDYGSSPVVESDTYRGTHMFSEAETKAIRSLCLTNQFKMVINYHAFADVMIYPWGFIDQQTADSDSYRVFGEHLTKHSDFSYGLNTETLGYPVNGTADDWMYAQSTPEHKTFAFTFECGPAEDTDELSFWPLADKIQPLCEKMLYQNIQSLWLVNHGVSTSLVSTVKTTELNGTAKINVFRVGTEATPVAITIKPLTENVIPFTQNEVFTMTHLQNRVIDVPYQLKADATGTFGFLLELDFGGFKRQDTVYLEKQPFVTRFENNGNDLSVFVKQQNGNNWEIDRNNFYSGNSSFALNNLGQYDKAENKILQTLNPIAIPASDSIVYLSFIANWEIEKNTDYFKVQISTNGTYFQSLCGQYTSDGSIEQGEHEPVLDGFQPNWVNEIMDISDFAGQSVYLRFIFRSDGRVHKRGINIDDIAIVSVEKTSLRRNNLTKENNFTISPNPAKEVIYVHGETEKQSVVSIFDLTGKLQKRTVINRSGESIDVSGLPSGIYYYQVAQQKGQTISTGKFTVIN